MAHNQTNFDNRFGAVCKEMVMAKTNDDRNPKNKETSLLTDMWSTPLKETKSTGDLGSGNTRIQNERIRNKELRKVQNISLASTSSQKR